MKAKVLMFLFLQMWLVSVYAQSSNDVENQVKVRTELDFQIKLTKGLNLNLSPELRFADGFDKLLLNGGLTYKTFNFIYWGASYHLVVDKNSTFGSTAYHKYAFDVTYKDDFGRFTPSFRLRYNNYADEEVYDKEYLRYRAKLSYNIRNCKLNPYVAVEWVQELDDMMLYKTRYVAGGSYKFNKRSSLSLDYKLDYFNLEYKNAHILSLGYKHKF
ncbi:MAG: DUF2490 domain-containing protein [Rikenellaceae bacterium]